MELLEYRQGRGVLAIYVFMMRGLCRFRDTGCRSTGMVVPLASSGLAITLMVCFKVSYANIIMNI